MKIIERKSLSSGKPNGPKASLSAVPEYNDPIEILNLSSRSTKALKSIGITTVKKLLDLSYQSLYTIKNIGKKSAEELLLCQEKLTDWGLQKKGNHDQNDIFSLDDSVAGLNMSIRSTKALNNSGINTIKKFLELKDQDLYAIKNIGKKNTEEILSRRNNIRKIMVYKDNSGLSGQQDPLERMRECFRHIPESRLNKPIRDYLSCCTGGLNTLADKFYALPESISVINDLPLMFESICGDDKKSRDFLLLLDILAFDVKESLDDIINKVFSNKKYNRALKTLQERIDGKTLQEISDKTSLTRERIRQIENRGVKLLVKYLNEFNLNLLAFANTECECGNIITVDELNEYLSGIKHADFFVYVLKTRSLWDGYTFNKKLNVFYNNAVITDINAVSDRIFALPDIIEEDKREDMLLHINRENNFPIKIIFIVFSYIYKHSGKVYHRNKLSLSRMYDYILEKYYPAGIKLFDDDIIEDFKNQLIDIFGSGKIPDNNRAIYAGIVKQSVLCGRGTYIYPGHIVISGEMIEEIDAYVAASPKKVISINELFENFKQKLSLCSNINNRYFLQGVLNIYLNEKYFVRRDTISKENN
jgi:Holliday junction resolvasome RuvABC DNA-binding subunit